VGLRNETERGALAERARPHAGELLQEGAQAVHELSADPEEDLVKRMHKIPVLVIVVLALCAAGCCCGCCGILAIVCNTRDGQGACNEVFALVMSVFLPPLGVWWRFGMSMWFIVSIVLTVCGYFPGVVFSLFLIAFKPTDPK